MKDNKILTIVYASLWVSITRENSGMRVFVNPTEASLHRIERLVPYFQCSAWLYQDSCVLFIHTEHPISQHGYTVREQPADYQLPLLTIEDRLAIKPIKHKAKFDGQDIAYVTGQIQYLHKRLSEMLEYAKPTDRPAVHSPADIVELVQPVLQPLQHEELWVVLLDTRNRVLKMCQIYKGSANSSQVRVGEIFRDAVREQATSIIVVHNHPSGDPTPSPDDVAMTRAIQQAGKLLDIDLLDHLVIGRERFVSLKERGLGF